MPLTNASLFGPIRCIYIVEPSLWTQSDVSLQHFEFIRESIVELDAQLRTYGGSLEIHFGEAGDVLSKIWAVAPFQRMHSHEETGNQFTYKRDQRVASWCKQHRIEWAEYPQFGVIRGLKDRDLWQRSWEKHMAAPIQRISGLQFWKAYEPKPISMEAPSHLKHNPPMRQRGGRSLALSTLNGFLSARSMRYRGGISSPLSAPDACSRLSVYLSYGCISMREVVQKTRQTITELPSGAERHRSGLIAFLSRLHWHCHFIQKLESEPAIEWRNMHQGYNGLREQEFNQDYFEALKAAQTGWPMVDACVMMLKETGWLNFRMRAMLVSVAAYPLWLHWRPVGEWLATQFLDYEPGIHWSQLQMQSGTTGINTTRVYNPIKQAQDHDPRGIFVKKWLPRMRHIPDTWLFEPWKMTPEIQQHLGLEDKSRIIVPIVDLEHAIRTAKDRVHGLKKTPQVKAGNQSVVKKHASRSTQIKRRALKKENPSNTPQLGFDF